MGETDRDERTGEGVTDRKKVASERREVERNIYISEWHTEFCCVRIHVHRCTQQTSQ